MQAAGVFLGPNNPFPGNRRMTIPRGPFQLKSKGKESLRLLFWSFLVGVLAGFVGALFRLCLNHIGRFREWLVAWAGSIPYWGWVIPVLFSVLLVSAALFLVRRFAPEAGGSGVQEIEGALEEIRPVRWKRVLPVKFFAGLASLGGGMVLGREGPTIQMGGNVGKMIGETFRASSKATHILVASGAAAGLSAAFNAPLAGVLFVIEEMRTQFRYGVVSVQCILIASAMGDIVVRIVTGPDPVIHMTHLPDPQLSVLWMFPLFGVLFGFFGLLFNYLLVGMLDVFSRLRGGLHRFTGLFAGAFIGFLVLTFPDTITGGYSVIPKALYHILPAATLLLLFVVRFGTTVFSYGSGVPGGIFAPMITLGTLFGVGFGHYAHGWFPDLVFHPSLFAVAGMGALFAATVRAPLTGIALAVEMTGNYNQILPLILTCMAATVVAQGFGGQPIYTVLLRRTISQEKKAIRSSREQKADASM